MITLPLMDVPSNIRRGETRLVPPNASEFWYQDLYDNEHWALESHERFAFFVNVSYNFAQNSQRTTVRNWYH